MAINKAVQAYEESNQFINHTICIDGAIAGITYICKILGHVQSPVQSPCVRTLDCS